MKWFKLHPEWLANACRDLAGSSDYQQVRQCLGNALASTGYVLVRLNKLAKHPVLVVFPDATPYSPPVVYLLEAVLSEADLAQVANASLRDLATLIAPKVKWHFRRHQNADGSLCLIEGDHLYAEKPELLSVSDVLQRVRDWLAGLSTGRLPPDSPEVDFYAHYPRRAEAIHFLVPDPFYGRDTCAGMFVATKPCLLNHSLRDMYLIVGTIGTDAGGVCHPPVVLEGAQEQLFAKAPDLVKALAADQLMTDLANGIIVGYWLTVEAEPSVFADVEQMASAISPGAPDQGVARLASLVKVPLVRCQTPIHLGLRYPSRRGDLEWQVLQLARPSGMAGLVTPSVDDLAEQFRRHEITAVRTTPFTETGFHRRNEGRAPRAKLRSVRVSVIGCGAVGSEVADSLSKAGVGRITLVDQGLLHPNNVVRHVLGLNASEFPKTIAMQMQMLLHNPFSLVDPQQIDIRTHDIKDYLADDAIGVSSLADDNIEALLNEQAVMDNKVIFYVRSIRGGKAGRIFRVIPGRDACKCCLALYAGAHDPSFPAVAPDPSLPTITNECNNPIRPASAADLKLLAAFASGIVLDHLQGRISVVNHWVWTSEPLAGFSQPLPNGGIHGALHGSFLPPHRSCSVCAPEDPMRVELRREVRDFIQRESAASGDVETGGVLVGKRTRGVGVVVTVACGPGPKAVRSRDEFRRDVAYCQRFLEAAAKERGDDGLYVGEWHYHPHGPAHPSNQDLRSLSEIAEQPEYLTERPILLIVGRDGGVGCTVHPFSKRHYPVTWSDA